MQERLVLVVSSGGNEAHSMVKGIRGAGIFCTMSQMEDLTVAPDIQGIVVIGEYGAGLESCMRSLLTTGLPLLAFGAPAVALVVARGGQVTGHAFTRELKDVRFSQLGVCTGVEGGLRMLENAEQIQLPEGYRLLAGVEGAVLAFDNGEGTISGFQFMPEAHDVEASEIIGNFLWKVLKLRPNFTMEGYIEHAMEEIRQAVGEGEALCVLTGGVDSTAAACLAQRAVGDKLHCLVIDTGLARTGDIERMHEILGEQLGLRIRHCNAQGRMMETLAGCIAPAEKRDVVARFIGLRIADEVDRLGGNIVVVRATNYPDIVQKHCGAVLPAGFPSVEPLRPLFKNEVRAIAKLLSVHDEIVTRQHYPSAGIALRCMGAVNAQNLAVLRAADEILQKTLDESGQVRAASQVFAVLADFSRALGSDVPRYVIILRAVNGSIAENASILRLPVDVLERVTQRILESVEHVYRVVYDLTPVPPALIEWE